MVSAKSFSCVDLLRKIPHFQNLDVDQPEVNPPEVKTECLPQAIFIWVNIGGQFLISEDVRVHRDLQLHGRRVGLRQRLHGREVVGI